MISCVWSYTIVENMTENMKLFKACRMTGFFLGLKLYIPSFLDSHLITYNFMADIPLRTAV